MHRRFVLTAAFAAIAGHTARADPPLADPAFSVVASFSVLGDMVRQIGASRVKVTTLVGPDEDTHVYQPRPHDLMLVAQAAVLVRNGLGLEGWMDRLTGAAGFHGRDVVAAEKVVPRRMRTEGGAAATDPHAWQDPRNGILYANAIAAGLANADPPNAAAYVQAAQSFAAQIGAMDQWIGDQFAPIPSQRRRIITTHDAFGYYGGRYGIEFLAAEGISTESEPSARAMAGLIRQIRQEKVPAVFIENMTSPRLARMLAQETGAKLGGEVYSDALSRPDGPAATYLDMLRHNTTLFVKAMA